MSDPKPDQFGRYRVAETIDGKTRHYSTARYIPGVHRIVEGPDAAASYANGQPRPALHNVRDTQRPPAQQPAQSTTTAPKGA